MNMKIIIITSIFMFISLVVARSDADCLSNQVNSNIAFIAVALTLLLIIAFAYFFLLIGSGFQRITLLVKT